MNPILTGLTKCEGHTKPVVHLAFSNIIDGKYHLAAAGQDTLATVRDGYSGELETTIVGHTLPVLNVAFSSDSRFLATSSEDSTVRLWNAHNGKELQEISLPEAATCVTWHEDNNHVAASCMGERPNVYVYDLNASEMTPLVELDGHRRGVKSIVYVRGGNALLTSSYDRSVRMWDLKKGANTHTIELPHHAKAVEVNKDETTVIIAYGNKLIYLDIRTFQIVKHVHLGYKITTATLHPDKINYFCGCSDGHILLYSYNTDSYQDSYFTPDDEPIYSLKYGPNGETIACAHTNGGLNLWKTT
ncbi:hypothetical protein KR018_005596 [Drosophila ironensis]|nr:hypothetical protein KR018_005596 [Drosophila ironensis]